MPRRVGGVRPAAEQHGRVGVSDLRSLARSGNVATRRTLRGSDRELRQLIGHLSARTAKPNTPGGNHTALG